MDPTQIASAHTTHRPVKGRFAPSPTGRMHLGNLFTALLAWLQVRRSHGRFVLRIEDLDPQRSRLSLARFIEDDLHWLGLDWDEGGVDGPGTHGPYCQSRRHEIYEKYLARLIDTGMCYPCTCTRAEILATQAPHHGDNRVIYGGRCRPASLPCHDAFLAAGRAAVRIAVPDTPVPYYDIIRGPGAVDLAACCGDFVLRRADGAWAYQLAVVVDDALMGITHVLRGADLLDSAAQQNYLYRQLGFEPPVYAHVPLVCNARGIRLSKRDGSLGMEALRRRFTPRELTGQLAAMAGLIPAAEPCDPADLIPLFDPARLIASIVISY